MKPQATPERSSSGLSLEDLDIVVDADAHVMEAVEDFLPYMDDRYDGVRRQVESAPHPENSVYSHTRTTPGTYDYDESGNVHGLADSDVYTGSDGQSPDVKLTEMESFGIDHSVVTPTLNLGLTTVNNPDIAVALANAYNNWMGAEFLDTHGGIATAVAVAPQDPDRAAEEIDRWADEDDVVAVVLPAGALLPAAGDRRYDPIYEAAQNNDLPVLHHGSTAQMGVHFPRLRAELHTNAEDVTLSHPFQIMTAFTTTMLRGVPERFRDLDLVFQEAGVTWVPYMLWRLDDQYLAKADEISRLRKLPSDYVYEDGNIYFTTQPVGHTARNPQHLAWALEMAGPEVMLYSADLPHPAFDPPNELFDRICRHFDEETVRGIMGETARELFDL